MGLFSRHNRNVGLVLTSLVELHNTIAESEKGMVLTHANILARIVDSTALTDDDVAGDARLTAKDFHAQTFAFGFTTVTGTTDTFFMSHNIFFLKG